MRREILRRGGVRIGLALVRGFRVRFVGRGRLGILVMLFYVTAFGGVGLVLRATPFFLVMIFFSMKGLLQRLIVKPCGVGQRLTRQDFHWRRASRRQRRGRVLLLLVGVHWIIVFQIFENVADIQERVAVETDVDESGLHTGKDAGDFSFVDAADQCELFFALDVDFD
jgi:hypothetical protein